MNKPLTKLERDHIADMAVLLTSGYPIVVEDMVNIIQRLRQDGAFWREAVKNATVHRQVCAWCAFTGINGHNPDCPWLLAQEL